MKLLDVDILLAAHRTDHPHHEVVRPFFDRVTAGPEPFAVPGVVWAGFVRLATNRRVFAEPTSLRETFAFVRAVAGQPNHVVIAPGPDHLSLLESVCDRYDAVGDLVPDAHLAAIALEHDCTLVSMDRDFARFTEVRWERPEA